MSKLVNSSKTDADDATLIDAAALKAAQKGKGTSPLVAEAQTQSDRAASIEAAELTASSDSV